MDPGNAGTAAPQSQEILGRLQHGGRHGAACTPKNILRHVDPTSRIYRFQ
jgi:hypothetical protein